MRPSHKFLEELLGYPSVAWILRILVLALILKGAYNYLYT
tara:strand:+ start:118 stop:237 length:120 start_codon:yes stop_codon:yes gene_type:complete